MITDKERRERLLGVGGSDMPILLGLSNYKTPYQLYLEKIGESSIQEPTECQIWGNLIESVVLEEFARRNNVKVKTLSTIVHPFLDHLRGNVDGYIEEWDAILEIKCVDKFNRDQWGESGSDVIPMSYIVQVATYCMIKDASCAYVAVLIGGNEYRQYKYERNYDLEEHIIRESSIFWECVQKRIAPPPLNQLDLRLMYPKHDPSKVINVNPLIKNEITQLSQTKQKIKELTELEEQYKFNVMQFMKDAEYLTDNDDTPLATWKTNKKGSRTFLIKGL